MSSGLGKKQLQTCAGGFQCCLMHFAGVVLWKRVMSSMFLLLESWLLDIFWCDFSSTAAKPRSASEAAAVLPAAHHREAFQGDVWHVPVPGSQQRGQSLEQHRPGQCHVLPEQLLSSRLSRVPSFPFLIVPDWVKTGGHRLLVQSLVSPVPHFGYFKSLRVTSLLFFCLSWWNHS